MDNDNIDQRLSRMEVPKPGPLHHQGQLKVPLLSYRRSSRLGLALLVLPLLFFATVFLRYELGLSLSIVDIVARAFASISDSPILHLLIPVIFIGIPLYAMVINLLSFCHFASDPVSKEMLVTVKYRPLNMIVFLISFVVLVYAFLPDALP